MGGWLEQWLERHGVERLDAMRGRASLRSTGDRDAFERAHLYPDAPQLAALNRHAARALSHPVTGSPARQRRAQFRPLQKIPRAIDSCRPNGGVNT